MSSTSNTLLGFPAAFLCLLALAGQGTPGKGTPIDRLRNGTVWSGVIEYDAEHRAEPTSDAMILYLEWRKGNDFGGSSWYPNQGNGVLKVTGKVGRSGVVTFTEEKVIHGKANFPNNPEGVQAPNEFSGVLDGTRLKGTGRWKRPAFNGETRKRFTLKLADSTR